MKRNLKVSAMGDFWLGKVVPQIRLQGKWLEKAGIAPESRVEVENPSPGVLVIHLLPAAATQSPSRAR
ncbi:MAG: SymE family type I addiction module toxin [Anaerolineales bacterium]